jgi:hypothetical protein
MGPANLLEALNQLLVGSIEKHDLNVGILGEFNNHIPRISEECATPSVHHGSDFRHRGRGVLGEGDEGLQHLGREIIDHVPTVVLKGVRSSGAPGS